MPVRVLRAYSDALPQLQAAQQTEAINAIAAGAGHMTKRAHEEYLAALKRRLPQPGPVVPTAADLASLGIAVHV